MGYKCGQGAPRYKLIPASREEFATRIATERFSSEQDKAAA
jgi:hypothetical protein